MAEPMIMGLSATIRYVTAHRSSGVSRSFRMDQTLLLTAVST